MHKVIFEREVRYVRTKKNKNQSVSTLKQCTFFIASTNSKTCFFTIFPLFGLLKPKISFSLNLSKTLSL